MQVMAALRTVLPLLFVAVAVVAAGYGLFAQWAVNAPAFGERDTGWALFFAMTGAIAFVTAYWLVPIALGAAIVVGVTRWGSPWLYLVAAGVAALPMTILG
jgi:hypothetical protein